jgi:hypothetical protein
LLMETVIQFYFCFCSLLLFYIFPRMQSEV